MERRRGQLTCGSRYSWYYTEDEHIAITGGTQCLDSAFSSGGSPQTYTVGRRRPPCPFLRA